VHGVVSTLLGWWLGGLDVGLALGLGYLSHVLADGLTLAGAPLLRPWRKENVHLLPRALRLRTGGPVEPLVFIAVTVLLIVLLPALFPAAMLRRLVGGW